MRAGNGTLSHSRKVRRLAWLNGLRRRLAILPPVLKLRDKGLNRTTDVEQTHGDEENDGGTIARVGLSCFCVSGTGACRSPSSDGVPRRPVPDRGQTTSHGHRARASNHVGSTSRSTSTKTTVRHDLSSLVVAIRRQEHGQTADRQALIADEFVGPCERSPQVLRNGQCCGMVCISATRCRPRSTEVSSADHSSEVAICLSSDLPGDLADNTPPQRIIVPPIA